MWLARRHDERMKDRALTDTDADRPMRHAARGAAQQLPRPGVPRRCCASTASRSSSPTPPGKWPLIREVTADFVYVRLHGDKELYTSGYTDAALDRVGGD